MLLLGCTEQEEKQFMDAVIKDSIDQANPFHSKPSASAHPSLKPYFDDREACDDANEQTIFTCQSGSLYQSKCDGNWRWKEFIGASFETCDGYYRKLSCDGFTLIDTGSVEEVTYCLASGMQFGKTYCRDGVIKHSIVNCEDNGQLCKETSAGVHECKTAPPKGYCDFNYLTSECPISCYPSGSDEAGKQCLQSK